MPVDGKVFWSIVSTEIVDGDVDAVVEMRIGSELDPVFAIVKVHLLRGMTLEESRSAMRDSCYVALRRKREAERAAGVIARLPSTGVEDFTS